MPDERRHTPSNIGTNNLPLGFEQSEVWHRNRVQNRNEWSDQLVRAQSFFDLDDPIYTEVVDPIIRHFTVVELAEGYERTTGHQESSVLAHSVDVLEQLVPTSDRVLLAAALTHDIGKMVTLAIKPGEAGAEYQTSAKGHEEAGLAMLQAAPDIIPDPNIRDDVMYIVGNHMRPGWLYKDHQTAKSPEKTINKALRKWGDNRERLLAFATADICKNPDFEEMSRFYTSLKSWVLPEDQ